MSAGAAFKPLSMSEALLPSLPAAFFSSKPPLLHLPLLLSSKPLPLLHISSSPSSSSTPLRKNLPLLALVAKSSVRALQEQEEETEVSDGGLASEGHEEGVGLVLEELEGEEEQREDGGIVAEGDEEEDPYVEPPSQAKLFVGNLPYDMNSEQLAQIFQKAGFVYICEVVYNRDTGRSRGFGFVTMSTVEEAEKALEMFHLSEVHGKLLTVNVAAPRGARVDRSQVFQPSFRIYVTNLPWEMNSDHLHQVFSQHGKVLEAKVVCDRQTGRSRGFGFVIMASQADMDNTIAALNGQSFDGRTLRLTVARERP